MSGWAPGDRALCVREPSARYWRGPAVGSVSVVTVVDLLSTTWLRFAEFQASYAGRPNRWSDARRFRKIRPLSEEETREFVADLQDGKPVPALTGETYPEALDDLRRPTSRWAPPNSNCGGPVAFSHSTATNREGRHDHA